MTIRLLAVLVAFLGLADLASAFDPFKLAGIDQRSNARIPLDLSFRDETGAEHTLRDLASRKPIVLVPVQHNCPNICGVTLAGLAQAIHAEKFKPGRDFTLIAFGIDPNEGPPAAKASLDRLRQSFPDLGSDGVHALTGNTQNVEAVTSALGYRYAWDERISQFAHVAAIAILTSDGQLSHWLYGLAPEPTDLSLALTEAGQGQIGTWTDQLLILCYHYDPQTGRYGSIIAWILRLGGGLTVATAGGWIGFAILRERQGASRRDA